MLAAAFAGCAGALLGMFQGYMPPDAFALPTSGQLVIQTVIGGTGTLIGPTVGAAVWLLLRELLQQLPSVGDLWLFILGFVFVILVTFLPNGIVGAALRLRRHLRTLRSKPGTENVSPGKVSIAEQAVLAPVQAAGVSGYASSKFALEARNVSKSYGGIHAIEGVSLALPAGRFHAIIGPNGAGKSTFLRLLNREENPDSRAVSF